MGQKFGTIVAADMSLRLKRRELSCSVAQDLFGKNDFAKLNTTQRKTTPIWFEATWVI